MKPPACRTARESGGHSNSFEVFGFSMVKMTLCRLQPHQACGEGGAGEPPGRLMDARGAGSTPASAGRPHMQEPNAAGGYPVHDDALHTTIGQVVPLPEAKLKGAARGETCFKAARSDPGAPGEQLKDETLPRSRRVSVSKKAMRSDDAG